jgi:tRNA1(Val) A37 N6-methylase TrmN6
LKLYSGVQAVSNFRPTAAKVIYEKFGGDGVIWDMSCGWGGRLLGFLSSSNTKHYIGTEPSTRTYKGLLQMSKEFDYINKKIDIYKQGSEEYLPNKSSLDLCFTSPPYFDTEKYSDEPTQSYIKYPTQDEWVNGFLRKTIENCYYGLKEGGYMLYNIANTPKYKFIEEETVKISKELGFAQEDTLQLTLSSVMGAGYKYEPVFVFRK